MTERGKYIVIEGHDGTGKSTQVGLLREKLAQDHGIKSVEYHEPDGTPISSKLREVIKDGTLDRDPITNFTSVYRRPARNMAAGSARISSRPLGSDGAKFLLDSGISGVW